MQAQSIGNAMVDFIRVRVPIAQKRALVVAAMRQGITLSELLRQAMTEATQKVAA